MTEYIAYATALRHELHQCPEIGFDLPETLAIVRRELNAMGITFTEEYCKSSIVGTINPEKSGFTIGIRADMDALPIEEKSQNPYPSRHTGKMHACGHDVHTAILLAVARVLQDRRSELSCRVKLLFTPAEEYIHPGCKELAASGVMDDIDCVVTCHSSPDRQVGTVAMSAGPQASNSMGFTMEFYGSVAHAASQQRGKDAIAMAVQAYMAMEVMVAKELSPLEPRLLNIGAFNGGHTNNIICDYCKLFGSCRSHSDENSAYLERRLREICEGVAAMNGGRGEFKVTKFLPYIINNEKVTERMVAAAAKIVGAENVLPNGPAMGADDFSFLSRKKPGVLFRLGTGSDLPGTTCTLHSNHFDVDERCFGVAIPIFVQFVMDNMDGIHF